ncbi:MAG TPA: polysaccharide deacetylase family protein [Candidatus Methylomirabilis sp.]|nr:polysaccharide deacetylase family protein [Candidatus Methylomirabilis sp.]
MLPSLSVRPIPPFSRPAVNALTVDLEDWYHVCGPGESANPAQWDAYESRVARSTDRLLSLLRAHGTRATFFVLGYIAEKEPALIRAIAREGHEVGTHGHFHRRIFELSPAEFAEDLGRSMDAISTAFGGRVVGYRAPEWSMRPHTLWALSVLRRSGILYDSSMVPLTRMGDRSFPRFPCRILTESGAIAEFPLTTVRCFQENLPFSGGLPLRLTPYFYVLAKIRRLNRAGRPALVYVHPWEFDPDQPRIDLPWSRSFMHYFNLAAAPRKFEGLLGQLRFAPVREILDI